MAFSNVAWSPLPAAIASLVGRVASLVPTSGASRYAGGLLQIPIPGPTLDPHHQNREVGHRMTWL